MRWFGEIALQQLFNSHRFTQSGKAEQMGIEKGIMVRQAGIALVCLFVLNPIWRA
jgi:hypothetical protein